jgi:tripartite ATP-independent transporter DctM subunit
MLVSLAVLLTVMVLGVPIGFAIGVSGLAYFLLADVSMMIVTQKMVGQLASVPLLGVPFFILAGELMTQGGITVRLFNFALAIVGRIPGALGHANIVASMIFSGISGSAVADIAGLGKVELDAMRRNGYPDDISIGVTAASSTLGPIIPPSINAVIFGSMAAVPIGPLLIGGIIPGIIAGIAMMITFAIIFARRGIVTHAPPKIGLIAATRDAIGALLTPVILLGAMFSGIATPTEAAVLACVYAWFVAALVYRELTLSQFAACLIRTTILSGAVMLIIGLAAPLGYVVARERVAADLTLSLVQYWVDPTGVVIAILVMLLLAGCVLEVGAAIILLTPLIYPALLTLNFDPVHIGMIIIFGLGIGLITPPVGLCLFVGSQISGLSLHRVAVSSAPYVVALIAILILLSFVPQLTTWLPELVYGKS